MDHLPALEVLSVECVNVEAAITSHSLVEVEIGAFPRAPFQVQSRASHPVARATSQLHI